MHGGDDDLTQVFFNPDHEGWLVKEGEIERKLIGEESDNVIVPTLIW